MTVSDLKIIASNGGGMILDAKSISASDLKIICSNASAKQATVIIRNSSELSSSDIKIMASNSKGCAIFDFCN